MINSVLPVSFNPPPIIEGLIADRGSFQYYSAFTAARLLSAPLSRVLTSRRLLWSALFGTLGSLAVLLLTLAPQLSHTVQLSLLWVGSGLLGATQGPLWPAMM